MIYGMWYGGTGSYSHPYVDNDVETFADRQQAIDTLRYRREDPESTQQEFVYVNRDAEFHYVIDVRDDSSMTIWYSDPTGDEDPYPDEVIVYSDLD